MKINTGYLKWKASIYFIFFILVIVLARITFERNKIWNNEFSLWYETVKAVPASATTHFNLANEYSRMNLLDKAIEEYNITLKLDSLSAYEVLNNLGNVYVKKGLIEEAIKIYKEAISISPNRATVYHSLAVAYGKKRQYNEAIEAGLKALRYNPFLDDARYNLALSYTYAGFIDEAITEFGRYLVVNPYNPVIYVNIGYLYYKKGNHQKAKEYWTNALRVSKDYQPAKGALGLLRSPN
jgi:tetratricopeptide (TPR) repeat protein